MRKEYLPSKNFIKKLISILIIIIIGFVIFKTFTYFNTSRNNKPTNLIVKEVVQKDSNNNGIADWEEFLWGLDPKKNGEKNKEFIDAQKAKLVKNGQPGAISANDELAQQFFVAIVSLQESGNLDEKALQNISDAVGKKIEATPIDDIYTENSLATEKSTVTSIEKFRKNLSVILKKYQNKNIGDELTFISQGVLNKDKQALYAAVTVARYYHEMGQELMKMTVPNSYTKAHLNLANDYEKNSKTIEDMANVLDDQITGMKALINYKKYNDSLVNDLKYLSEN